MPTEHKNSHCPLQCQGRGPLCRSAVEKERCQSVREACGDWWNPAPRLIAKGTVWATFSKVLETYMHYFHRVNCTENFPLKFYQFRHRVFLSFFPNLTPQATQLPIFMRNWSIEQYLTLKTAIGPEVPVCQQCLFSVLDLEPRPHAVSAGTLATPVLQYVWFCCCLFYFLKRIY